MSNRAIEFIKEHPVGLAVGAGAIVLLYVYANSGSSASTSSGSGTAYADDETALAEAGQQFQIASLQSQTQGAAITAQQEVTDNQTQAGVTVAGYQSQDNLAATSATQAIQTNADDLSAQTTQVVSALQAQVAEGQTNAQVEETQINANAYVDIASLPYMASNAQIINQLNADTIGVANAGQAINNIITGNNVPFLPQTNAPSVTNLTVGTGGIVTSGATGT